MDWKHARRFLVRWLWYTFRDALAQTFGWLTLFGLSVGGWFLPKLGVHPSNDAFTTNVVGAFGGFVLGICIYAILGLFKAHWYLDPLVLTVVDDVRPPDFAYNDQMRGYAVAVMVRNRSDAFWKDCTAHVVNLPLYDGSIGPRFVEQFDLPPKSKKTVYVAYWFSRESPNVDDKDIGLTGPWANGYGGNACRVSGAGTNLHVRVRSPDVDGKEVQCRVWIDTEARVLKAATCGGM